MTDIVERLRTACVGKPAKISWPHRLLHDAADTIEALRREVQEIRNNIPMSILQAVSPEYVPESPVEALNWARDCHRAAHMTACHWNDGGKLMPDTLYNIRAARAYLDCILTGHRFDGDSHLAATVKEIVDSEEAA